MEIQKNYFSKMDLSKELGVSLRSVDNWISNGLISFSRLGRRIIFSRKDIEEFLQHNRQASVFEQGSRLEGCTQIKKS